MRHLICITFCLLLCSCIVLPETYYLPVSDVGGLGRDGCGIGPNKSLTIEEDEVAIKFRLYKGSFELADVNVDLPINHQAGNKYLVLSIEIYVSPGNFAVMHNQELGFSVNSADNKKYKFHSYFFAYPKFHKLETFIGPVSSVTGLRFDERLEYIPNERGWGTNYQGDVWLDVDDADSVRVDQIDIEVNGRKIEIGHIDFIKKSGLYIQPMNC